MSTVQVVLKVKVEDGLTEEEQEHYINNLVGVIRNRNLSFFFMKGLKHHSKTARDVIESGWTLLSKKK